MKTNNAITRQIKLGLFGLGAALSLLHIPGAAAETTSPASLDYVEIFKTKIFPCIHPTVKIDTVKIELSKAAATAGDITTARVQAFYQGLINKNSIQVDSWFVNPVRFGNSRPTCSAIHRLFMVHVNWSKIGRTFKNTVIASVAKQSSRPARPTSSLDLARCFRGGHSIRRATSRARPLDSAGARAAVGWPAIAVIG